MALSTSLLVLGVLMFPLLAFIVEAQLSNEGFYEHSCPSLQGMVQSTVSQALDREPIMGASILRLFFHDCFVNGCDASILLDDTPIFTGEKNANPNLAFTRVFEVIDEIKSTVEAKCPATVSCADILALAARDSVSLLGGPAWEVRLGRLDSRNASQSDVSRNIPSPSASLTTLISRFAAKGLNAREMTALAGAHTIGQAHCALFRTRIHNESNIDPAFAEQLKTTCPIAGGGSSLSPLDGTTNSFDNEYYKDLVAKRGLLHSDQQLFNGGSQDSLVKLYSENSKAFEDDFAAAMVKMGSLLPNGNDGEIRVNCRVVN